MEQNKSKRNKISDLEINHTDGYFASKEFIKRSDSPDASVRAFIDSVFIEIVERTCETWVITDMDYEDLGI